MTEGIGLSWLGALFLLALAGPSVDPPETLGIRPLPGGPPSHPAGAGGAGVGCLRDAAEPGHFPEALVLLVLVAGGGGGADGFV